MFLNFTFFDEPRLFLGDFFQQYAGRFIVGVLSNTEFAHGAELKDGLFELVDALFGGEQGIEVVGHALPGFGKFLLIGGIGEGDEKGFHQGLVGEVAVGLLLFQLVTEGYQFIDFGDDSVLFGEGGQSE